MKCTLESLAALPSPLQALQISHPLKSQRNSSSMILDHLEDAFKNCFRGKLERGLSFNSIHESQIRVKRFIQGFPTLQFPGVAQL